jgi:hypothetical protein
MKTPLILFVSIILSATSITAWSVEHIENVEILDTVTLDGTELERQGAGPRVWGFYGCGKTLYMTQKFVQERYTHSAPEVSARKIIEENKKFVILITIMSSFATRSTFTQKLDEGFDKWPERKNIEKEITQFKEAFPENFTVGDTFIIQYSPETGTTLLKKGESLLKNDKPEKKDEAQTNDQTLTTIDTNKEEFKKGLMNVWFDPNNPADEYLRGYLINDNCKRDK